MSCQSPRLACFITTNSQRAEKEIPKICSGCKEIDAGRYNWFLEYSVLIIKIFIASSYKWVLEYNVQHGDYS